MSKPECEARKRVKKIQTMNLNESIEWYIHYHYEMNDGIFHFDRARMQGRAEKKWDREKKIKKKKLLVSILYVHNHSMYHLTLLKERKKCAFLWKCCIPDLSPTHISHPFLQLTEFSMFSFSLCMVFWVGLFLGFVYLCVYVCQLLCVLQQQRSPGLSLKSSLTVGGSFILILEQTRLSLAVFPSSSSHLSDSVP